MGLAMDSLSYFDSILSGWHDGSIGRNVHLGYWNDLSRQHWQVNNTEFEEAQHRMTRYVVNGSISDRSADILDVGCGLGGTLDYLNSIVKCSRITGLNVDARQLRVCSTIGLQNENKISLLHADACEIPLPAQSQDAVFCIEAMFHFPSRLRFLKEAYRVLRANGRLILTDILISPVVWEKHRKEDAGISGESLLIMLHDGYGPWPQPFLTVLQLRELALEAGFVLLEDEDLSLNTLPSYSFICPGANNLKAQQISHASTLLAWLQAHGLAIYYYGCFEARKT